MPAVIRIDVDNPYPQTSWTGRRLNALRNELEGLFPVLASMGYLLNLRCLLDDLESRGIRASIFFRRSSVPTTSMWQQMSRSGHRPAYHATRTSDLREFVADLDYVRRHVPGAAIRGFSKHGSGQLKLGIRHTPEYDEGVLVRLGREASLEYFSGNGENPSHPPAIVEGLLFFPGAFWLNPSRRHPELDLDWLIQTCSTRVVVCLVHPRDYLLYDEVRRDLEVMASRVDRFLTFDEVRPYL